jgi:hypothetical protein
MIKDKGTPPHTPMSHIKPLLSPKHEKPVDPKDLKKWNDYKKRPQHQYFPFPQDLKPLNMELVSKESEYAQGHIKENR